MKKKFARLQASFLEIRAFIQGFFTDDILYHAASLSFYTIFALVPILLISLTIMTYVPNVDNYIFDIKSGLFSDMVPQKSEALANYLDTVLKNGLRMGFVGTFYIFLTSILFFKNYEYIVSKIFSTIQKSFLEALISYIILMSLTPIVLAVILFLSTAASSHFSVLFDFINLPFKSLLSLPIIWFIFFIIMKTSLNFVLPFKALLTSSFLTAMIWYIAHIIFTSYIFANSTYESLYGSFASILFFFLWIYVSWIIYLYGLKSTTVIEKLLDKKYSL